MNYAPGHPFIALDGDESEFAEKWPHLVVTDRSEGLTTDAITRLPCWVAATDRSLNIQRSSVSLLGSFREPASFI